MTKASNQVAGFPKHSIVMCFILAFVALSTTGCDGDSTSVTGTVTLNSEPLTEALIQFTPLDADGRIALAKTSADGTYQLSSSRNISDVAPGKYRVTITTSDITGEDDRGRVIRSQEKVPKKYNSNTELTKEVTQGANKIDFELAN